jgi:Calx-beta domain
VSVNHTGTNSGNNHSSSNCMMSPDGRFILFQTWATDLIENDLNGYYTDALVRDRVAGKTTPVSVNLAGTGTGSPSGSGDGVMSANGRFVTFTGYATDLTENDKTTGGDVFVRDLIGGTTTLASINSAGTGSANKLSYLPTISGDGRVVAFQSFATNLAPNDPNLNLDVFAISIAGGSLQFSASDYRIDESGGAITVKVKRTGSSKGAVSVDFNTRNGTAVAGRDYAATSGTLTFANGETVKTITIPVNEDALDENDETIYLFLSHPTGNSLLAARSRATLVIADND